MIIDGAYLPTHPTEKNRFIRVAENASLIKQHICDPGPDHMLVRSPAKPPKTQKGEKKKPLTGDDIGDPDAILQLSSLALGIMQEESNETLKQREVSVLKGRKGETGKFTVNWDFELDRPIFRRSCPTVPNRWKNCTPSSDLICIPCRIKLEVLRTKEGSMAAMIKQKQRRSSCPFRRSQYTLQAACCSR